MFGVDDEPACAPAPAEGNIAAQKSRANETSLCPT